jgi:hypothetical protein
MEFQKQMNAMSADIVGISGFSNSTTKEQLDSLSGKELDEIIRQIIELNGKQEQLESDYFKNTV